MTDYSDYCTDYSDIDEKNTGMMYIINTVNQPKIKGEIKMFTLPDILGLLG